jgi:hypothetical protein
MPAINGRYYVNPQYGKALEHDWIKRHFVVDTNPSAELVAAARARQKDRKRAY